MFLLPKSCSLYISQIQDNFRKVRLGTFVHDSFSSDFVNETYRNDPKFSDRYAWENSADPDQTEEQSVRALHCLPFRLHCLDSLLCGRAT